MTQEELIRYSILPTISGLAKGAADGLELHLTKGYEIRLQGILDSLRLIKSYADKAMGYPEGYPKPEEGNDGSILQG
jgi:hypothetical protein